MVPEEKRTSVFSEYLLMMIGKDNAEEDALLSMVFNENASHVIQKWITVQKLNDKPPGVRVGAVVYKADCGGSLTVRAKAIVPGKGAFYHEEPLAGWPSDHFKTKLLLVTGGA
jgi:hypothetical protein